MIRSPQGRAGEIGLTFPGCDASGDAGLSSLEQIASENAIRNDRKYGKMQRGYA